VKLEICTLHNGLPHGIAIISYEEVNVHDKFRGVGVFNHGKLHNTPFTCVDKQHGSRYSFSKMHNGRPADGSYYTKFYRNGEFQHVHSLNATSDVSGW
jgi:hypothetical protein